MRVALDAAAEAREGPPEALAAPVWEDLAEVDGLQAARVAALELAGAHDAAEEVADALGGERIVSAAEPIGAGLELSLQVDPSERVGPAAWGALMRDRKDEP